MAVGGQRSIEVCVTVEVHLDGRAPYQAQVKQMISELCIASLQPGAQVWLRVDPRDPSKVAIADAAPMNGHGPAFHSAPAYGPPGHGALPMHASNAPRPPLGHAAGAGFVAPDIGRAMKKSLLSPMTLFIVFITTVPITVIMLATFVDWSAWASTSPGSGKSAAPKGGYCAAIEPCCMQATNGMAAACKGMGQVPAAACKELYEDYAETAKQAGRSCH
jgi:hypothetical protein